MSAKLKVGVFGEGAWGKRIIDTLHSKTKHCAFSWSRNSKAEGRPEYPTDFVVIATPHHTHASLMRQCFERGIPFIVEKPAAPYYELIGLKEHLATARTTPFLVNHTLLFNPAIEMMVGLAHRDTNLYTPVTLRGEHGGPGPVRHDCNALLDYGCHGVALALWLSRAENVRGIRLHVGKMHDGVGRGPAYGAQNFVLHAHFEHLKLELRTGNDYPKKRLLYTTEYSAGTSAFTHRFREFPERELLAYIESDLLEVDFDRETDPLTNALDRFARVVKGEREADARFGWDLPMRTMQVLETCNEMLRSESEGVR